MKLDKKDDRIRTAFHESGHAVIGAVYGFMPWKATIVPQASGRGEVRTRVSSIIYRIPHRLTSWMLHDLAGIAAQDRFTGTWEAADNGGSADLESFDQHWWKLSALTDNDCGSVDDFNDAARFIVHTYWHAIRAFAKILLKKETIEHEELEAALTAAIHTDKYKYFPVPEHLCRVPLNTFIYHDVTDEAEDLKNTFGQALD